MKIELKTDNEHSSKSIFSVSIIFVIISIIVIFSNISFKLGKISKNYEISYLCKLLTVEKSPSNFKKLSMYTKLSIKQKNCDFCRELIKK